MIAVARQGERRSRRSPQLRDLRVLSGPLAEDRRPRGRPGRPSAPARRRGGDLEAENRELRKRTKQLEQENEILRRATAYFARDVAPKMMYPLVRDLAADRIPVAVTCRVLGLLQAGVLQVAGQPGQPARLGRRAPDQRRRRHPPRRPGVRLPVHRRRARRARHRAPAATGSTGCAPSSGSGRCTPASAACSRKPGPPVHDDLVERDVHRRQRRTSCG